MMTCSKCRNWLRSLLGVAALGAVSASAQTSQTLTPGNAVDVGGGIASGSLTSSQYIANPEFPYDNYFKDLNLTLLGSPKIGPGRGGVILGSGGFSTTFQSPLRRGFRPEYAEVKAGPLYIDFQSLSGQFFYSDNINLTEKNRKSGVVGIIGLGVSAQLQLSEGFQFSVAGRFLYLPFKGKFGVDGFGIGDAFAVGLNGNGAPAFATHLDYNFRLSNWDITLFDDFRIQNLGAFGVFGEGYGVNGGYTGERFDEIDRAGRLALGGSPGAADSDFDINDAALSNSGSDRFDSSRFTYVNTVGGMASSSVPTVAQTTFGYYHRNFWRSGSTSSPNQVDYSDTFFARIVSQRENLRFKPFAYYTASTDNTVSGWDQSVGGGVFGPITDQLYFYGNAGYVFSGNNDNTSLIWRLSLIHEASPQILQRIDYYRTRSDPSRNISENLNYTLSVILGPYLRSDFFAGWSRFEDLDSSNSIGEVYRIGGRMTLDLGQRSYLQLWGQYSEFHFENPALADYDVTTIRLTWGYRLGEKTSTDIFYQYQDVNTPVAGRSYYESMVGVNVVKRF